MVLKIKQPVHTHEVITKEGEIKILLDITLNINANGIQVAANPMVKQEEKEEEESHWSLPSFKTDNKIKFGKVEL